MMDAERVEFGGRTFNLVARIFRSDDGWDHILAPDGKRLDDCYTCKGSGTTKYFADDGDGYVDEMAQTCPDCRGARFVPHLFQEPSSS